MIPDPPGTVANKEGLQEGEERRAQLAYELALLHQQIEIARSTLDRLQHDVAKAENSRDPHHAAELVEANQNLIVATLDAQMEAEARKRIEAELRHADERKDAFLATLAHELRNPLAPISNGIHILQRHSHLSPELGKIQGMMERQVSHLVRLVDDLLDVSRVTRGKVELRYEHLRVATAIEHAVEACKLVIETAGHSIDVAPIQDDLVVYADPIRFCQVLSNLLNNAAKYTAPGGHIWISAEKNEKDVSISVRDDGMGLTTQMLSDIFEMFSQGGQLANSRIQGGLGVGLTLARALVEMQGGSVEARSEGLGCGSTFLVHMPLSNQPVERVRGATILELAARPKLLLIDDNQDAADSLKLVLENLGAEVQVEYDGPSGLARLAIEKPAAVLIDIGMPGMDGNEVARQIRATPSRANLTLIAVTGWGEERDKRRTQLAGFNHHLVKPVDLKELQTLLASLAT